MVDALLPGSGPSMSWMGSAYKTLAFHLFEATINFFMSFNHSANIYYMANMYHALQKAPLDLGRSNMTKMII